ncbi:MAG TPA: hypothetical protein VGQ83_07140 [Polyangia bacterium]|jgi:hypothetical protein
MSASRLRLPLLALCAAAVLLAPGRARSAPSAEELALAETLFRDARRLMRESRFAEACPKLEESQRLDPGGGTLLNLGLCHEGEGRTATAWAELTEALALARRAGRADREQLAREHLDGLRGRLSFLVVAVPRAADVRGLEVRRGPTAIRRPAWGTPLPVDPGPLELVVSAPGRLSRTFTATARVGQEVTVTLAPLTLDPADRRGAWRRPAALVLATAGLLGVAAGASCGALAIGRNSDAEARCQGAVCDATGGRLNHEARALALAASVTLGVGLTFAVAGTVLWLTAPRREAARAPAGPLDTRAWLVPTVTPGGGGLVVGGAF